MAHESLESRAVVLGVLLTMVGCSWSTILKLTLEASVLYTVKAYVDGLGTLLLQGFVGKGIGCDIIQLYYCLGLWVTHLFKSFAFWDSF